MKTNTKTITRITELEFSKEEVEFLESLCKTISEISEESSYSEDDMLVEIINSATFYPISANKPRVVKTETYYDI